MIDTSKPIENINPDPFAKVTYIERVKQYGRDMNILRVEYNTGDAFYFALIDADFNRDFCNIPTLSERVTEELAKVQVGDEVRVWGEDVHEAFRGKTIRVWDVMSIGFEATYVTIGGTKYDSFHRNGESGLISAFITPADWTPEMAEALFEERKG